MGILCSSLAVRHYNPCLVGPIVHVLCFGFFPHTNFWVAKVQLPWAKLHLTHYTLLGLTLRSIKARERNDYSRPYRSDLVGSCVVTIRKENYNIIEMRCTHTDTIQPKISKGFYRYMHVCVCLSACHHQSLSATMGCECHSLSLTGAWKANETRSP